MVKAPGIDLQLFTVSPLNTTGDANLSSEMKTYYERTLLERLTPNLVYAQFGQQKGIKKNSGKTVEWRRWTALAQANFTLTEGVTPTGQNLAVTAITATVTQHGNFVVVTDVLELTSLDPVLDEASELLGEQAGEYVDTLVRDVLMAGSNVLYSVKAKFNDQAELIRDTAASAITARNQITNLHCLHVDTVRIGKRIMQRNKVRPYRGEKSDNGRGEFVMICHADGLYDLETSKKWLDVRTYQDKVSIYNGEVGMIYGVRVVVSENAKIWTDAGSGGTYEVYGALLIGANAYGVVDISGSGNVEFIFKPKGSAGTEDPLNQRSTSAWKVMFTTKILEDLAILRIEHGFSDNV